MNRMVFKQTCGMLRPLNMHGIIKTGMAFHSGFSVEQTQHKILVARQNLPHIAVKLP